VLAKSMVFWQRSSSIVSGNGAVQERKQMGQSCQVACARPRSSDMSERLCTRVIAVKPSDPKARILARVQGSYSL